MTFTFEELHTAVKQAVVDMVNAPDEHLTYEEAAENPEAWAESLTNHYAVIMLQNRNK